MFLRQLRDKKRLLEAYRTVFFSDEKAGKVVLDNLINISKVAGLSSYAPGSDAMQMAYDEGRKSMINHILTYLHYDVDYIARINMILESRDRQQLNQEYE